MRRLVAPIACALVLTGVPLAAAAPAVDVAALTRIASKLSGLKAKQKLRVQRIGGAALERHATRMLDRDYPPARQRHDEELYRALGLLGEQQPLRPTLVATHVRGVRSVYDPVARRLYLRKGSNTAPAALAEIVRALQDQTYDLKRLSGLRRTSRDAALAAGAASEGHAAFVTQVLGGASLRDRPAVPRTPIGQFLGLQRGFAEATGARLYTSLHNVGGRAAVLSALREPPDTAEQVFHIHAFLTREPALPVPLPEQAAGFALQGDDTWGELDVRALLAVFQVPRLDAVGDGWGGGASAVYAGPSGRAVALVLAWDSELDAAQWSEAAETWVNEAWDASRPGFPAKTPCAAESCWNVAGRAIASARAGDRTALVVGPSVADAAALARELTPGS